MNLINDTIHFQEVWDWSVNKLYQIMWLCMFYFCYKLRYDSEINAKYFNLLNKR